MFHLKPIVTNCATINKIKQISTFNEKYALETGRTKLTTNKNVNNMGNAGFTPVSEPNNDIHIINKITGTLSKI